jgi:hypothetical protein
MVAVAVFALSAVLAAFAVRGRGAATLAVALPLALGLATLAGFWMSWGDDPGWLGHGEGEDPFSSKAANLMLLTFFAAAGTVVGFVLGAVVAALHLARRRRATG